MRSLEQHSWKFDIVKRHELTANAIDDAVSIGEQKHIHTYIGADPP